MRKLTVVAFISVDGVVQGPGGSDEDRDGGFEHGGWLVPYVDEQFMARVSEGVERLSALLLGRRTYQIFASSWPLTGPDDPIGSKLNAVPKYVASRTLDTVSWQNSTLLEGDTVSREYLAAALRQWRADGTLDKARGARAGNLQLEITLLKDGLVCHS